MDNKDIIKSRITLLNKVSTISCEHYLSDPNRTNLDIVLSLYLEFEELQTQIPKCIDDIIKNSIKDGNVVKTLKVKRGREMDLDQQFDILMCVLVIQTMEGKSKLNKYNENGLTLEDCVEKASNDCDTSTSNIYKCIKKYGNAFRYYIENNNSEISFTFNKNMENESKVTLKEADEPISEMIQEAIDILYH